MSSKFTISLVCALYNSFRGPKWASSLFHVSIKTDTGTMSYLHHYLLVLYGFLSPHNRVCPPVLTSNTKKRRSPMSSLSPGRRTKAKFCTFCSSLSFLLEFKPMPQQMVSLVTLKFPFYHSCLFSNTLVC